MTVQADISITLKSTVDNTDKRSPTYYQLILCSVAIGIVAGLVVTIYYFVLEGMMHGVWHTAPSFVELFFLVGYRLKVMSRSLLLLAGFVSD